MYKDENKMSATNLGTCIGFILLRPEVDDPTMIISDANLACELFKSLIEEPDTYFDGDFELDNEETESPNPTTEKSPQPSSQSKTSTNSSSQTSGSRPLRPIPTTNTQNGPQNPVTSTKSPQSSSLPSPTTTEGQGRERCACCFKFVFGYDRQTSMGKIYHAPCLQKLQSVQNRRPLPTPPPPEKIQEMKNKFLKQYEIHRSESTVQFDDIKIQSEMNEEQFQENLTKLVKKMQDGELESHEIGLKEKDKNETTDGSTMNGVQWLAILVSGGKNRKTHNRKQSLAGQDRPDQGKKKEPTVDKKFDPTAVGGVLLAPSKPLSRGRKMTLETFGRKTTEHVQQLFSKKDSGTHQVSSNSNPKETKRRSVFTSLKLERAEKVPQIPADRQEPTAMELVKEEK